jgi:glycosyltransferase involved in cell wall biosynthesis
VPRHRPWLVRADREGADSSFEEAEGTPALCGHSGPTAGQSRQSAGRTTCAALHNVDGAEGVNAVKQKPRLAVISPFLDKRHGSERIMLEWLLHLPQEFEIHIYSQRVEDVDLSKFTWHRIPKLPGPHLLNFLWWLAANRFCIGWDRHLRGLRHDLVFSSGANSIGADVMCVHIVFAEYVRQVQSGMRLFQNPVRQWPRLLHRKLYYRVANWMERRACMDRRTTLVGCSRKTAQELNRFYNRRDRIPVLYLGLDHSVFNPETRAALRQAARSELELPEDQLAVILVGNDWRNKGVLALLEALEQLRELPIELFFVSDEDPSACWGFVKEKKLENRVRFLAPRKDIEFYYAAADAYAGPSLQDSYGIPPVEAMACGLPVIVSASAGVAEIITHGVDGLILDDPKDSKALATMIRQLYEDEAFRSRLGERAAETARQYTWERNGLELAAIFEELLLQKSGCAARTLRQEL